jgi:hypothetical protein
MAIKKTAKMSAAPKKVASKKADPGKGVVTTAKENMNKIAATKNTKPKSDSIKAAQFNAERRQAMREFDQLSKYTKNTTPSQRAAMEKTNARIMAASDSTKKYTRKSLEQIKGLNRKK